MYLSDSHKALIISLVIYLSITAAVASWLFAKPIVTETNQMQVVPVSLAMFELPPTPIEQAVEQPTPEPIIETPPEPEVVVEPEPIIEPKPEPKPIEKPKPEPKPIEKPKPVDKPKPVEKPQPKVEPVQKAEPLPEKTDIVEVQQPIKPIENQPPQPTPAPVQPQFSEQDIEEAEKRYLGELSAALTRYAQDTYPRMAQRRNWQGQVKVEFTLLANGDIINVRLIDSSGRSLLDDAALSIFSEKLKNRFKPFPEQINRREWTHSVPIEYKLR